MFCQELQRTSVTMIQYIKKYLNSKIIVRYLSAIFVTPPSKTKLHCVAPNYAVVSLHFRAIINRRGELAENNQHGLFILVDPYCSQRLKNLWFHILPLFKLIQDQTRCTLSNISLARANSETGGRPASL